jgi:hypothetical protein
MFVKGGIGEYNQRGAIAGDGSAANEANTAGNYFMSGVYPRQRKFQGYVKARFHDLNRNSALDGTKLLLDIKTSTSMY